MDKRVAMITGTVFAGVLVAGAIAAPVGPLAGGPGDSDESALVRLADAPGAVLAVFSDEDEDDDEYEDEDHEDGDEREHRGEREHEDDDDHDEDDD
ncbi:MAG: hypothetical protein IPF51_09925 [Dehalococcoidia bacterium]|uniref:hypothetical protein n=1 Tax=Candidatus Amarobacter glycogenicus TaxID=3140699 RepID=UPI0031368DDB|nr:hypothetical protein [Dehalococcoidia bacterium]